MINVDEAMKVNMRKKKKRIKKKGINIEKEVGMDDAVKKRKENDEIQMRWEN